MHLSADGTRYGARHSRDMIHEIRVQGRLDDRWADWVAGLRFTHEHDGTTTLRGPLADQSALHGVLTHMRDLNVPVLSVRRIEPDAERAATMQAIVQDRYGSSEALRLREIDTPTVGDDEVLVRVHAASLHIGDVHLTTGKPYLMRIMGFGFRGPKSRVRGMDVAGTVEAVGRNVTQYQAGDDVFGIADGAFAQYARASADTLVRKPANVTFEQAAAVSTSAVVALQALRDKGGLRAGQKVLVVGASGGVGLFAVQIARSFGAEVTGVSSTAKMDLVRAAGAQHVIDYTREDFARSVQQYDLIVDNGGNRSLSDLRRVLAPNGTLVLVGGEGGDPVVGSGLWRMLGAALLSPFISQRLRPLTATTRAADLQVVSDLLETGKLTPVIDRSYPLSGVAEAFRYFESRRASGKLIIIP
jgi:NADPH:quinone reductase-like Zn-dependent oxidoreductase